MSIEFKDSAEMNKALESLALASKKTLREVIPPQARLFCADLAANTRPYGKDAAGQKIGQDRVDSRIRSVYLSVGGAVETLKRDAGEKIAKQFQRYLRKREYAACARVFNDNCKLRTRYKVGPFDGGALHRSQKDQKKVSQGLIVDGAFSKVEAYIRDTKKKVGFAKGGFATAARELGGVRGIPGYVTRQNSPGRGVIQESGDSLSVTIENNVTYIKYAYDAAGEARAIDFRVKQINKVIGAIGERNLKKSSSHLK